MKLEAKARLSASPDVAAALEIIFTSVLSSAGLKGKLSNNHAKVLTWVPADPGPEVVTKLIKGAKANAFTVPGKDGATASYKFGNYTFFLMADKDGSHVVMTYK